MTTPADSPHVVRWPCPKCYSPRTLIKRTTETKSVVSCPDCGHVWEVST